jgi:hypothetical protein
MEWKCDRGSKKQKELYMKEKDKKPMYYMGSCPKAPYCFLCGINGEGKSWYDEKQKGNPLYTPICDNCMEDSQHLFTITVDPPMASFNKRACEKVYGKLIREDDDFYYFEGKQNFGVTISKKAFFVEEHKA